MSLEAKGLYNFSGFQLDTTEMTLTRDGRSIQVTPKVYATLCVLIENAGRTVGKDEFMRLIWPDSFVEESNLTFNIGMLRKALSDDANDPTFIETVPRRGYRFIVGVEKIVPNGDDPGLKNGAAHTFVNGKADIDAAHEFARASYQALSPTFPFAAFSVLLVAGAVAMGGWWYSKSGGTRDFPIFAATFASEKLSTNGKVFHAVVSSDGKNVVYTNFSGDKQNVWLRQIETANNIEIIPPSDDRYAGLALSPDGNFLYFVRYPKGSVTSSLYRVSIFGGVPVKLLDASQGWISVSPDGAKISFVRCFYGPEEYCSLWIADALDGKNERKIVARPSPLRIADNEFSPDGKTIAFAVGQSENKSNEFGLAEVDVESGAERELTTQKFFNVKDLTWLPDKSALLVTASRNPNKNFRIWRVSPATDEAEPLTNDSENYSSLSLDKAARIAVSTRIKDNFALSVYQMENPVVKRTLANALHATFAPNGKIIFSSAMSGNDEIWSMNADGGGQRQLTNNKADDSTPVASSDGKFVFFSSNRTGAAHVWRMNQDGSNQTQITQIEGGFPLCVSPDGEWIYYRSALQRTLWRAATNAVQEQLILDRKTYFYAFSPDGSQVAFFEKQDDERIIKIVSIADGQPTKAFRLANGKAFPALLVWSADGKSLVYRLADGEFKNNSLWRQPLNAETPEKIVDLGDELVESFALAPDGKSFAVVQGNWQHDAVLLTSLK